MEYARTVRALLRNEAVVDERAYQRILGEDMPSAAELTGRKRQPPMIPPIQLIHGWPAERVQALQRETAAALGVPVEFRERLQDGSAGPVMVVIPGGRFLMGSPANERGRRDNELQHEVGITPFLIGKYPVTFEEFDRFCKADRRKELNDYGWGRGSRPVIDISWDDARVYCEWLSKQTGAPYRLPTEAEWEYACRAGSATRYYFGDDERLLEDYAWYSKNSERRTHPVGEKRANAWGLHDISGNVWEWVRDWYGDYSRSSSAIRVAPSRAPPGSPRRRLVRRRRLLPFGVSRLLDDPADRDSYLGFRLARTGAWPFNPFTLAAR